MKNKLSFEEMEQALLECCKNGFKVSREQLQRQFTI